MLKRILFILLIFPLFYSCQTDNTQIPDVLVDEWIYINNPSNIKLQSPGGWTYANGGIKGLIIYRVSDVKFKAYERSCPHLSPSTCTYLDVDNGITVICRCDKTEFLLATGEPLNGAPNGLKEYTVFYDSSTETIHVVN